jgi:transposase
MAGRFEGLSEMEWKLFEDVFGDYEHGSGRGRKPSPLRAVVNTLLFVLIVGSRWCDVPRGRKWASKSAAHRFLQAWEADGTLEKLKHRVLQLADERGIIRWEYGAIDGSFSPWEGWRRGSGVWV